MRPASAGPATAAVTGGSGSSRRRRDRRPGGVARLRRREEGDHRRELGRLAEAAHRDLPLPHGELVVGAGAAAPGVGARELVDARRARVAGHHVVHGDAVGRHLVGERAGEPGHRGAHAVAEDEPVHRLLHGDARDVDDAAPAPRLHPGEHGARQADHALEVRAHGGAPRLVAVALERAGGRAAAVGHEDVDGPQRGGRVGHARDVGRVGHVGRDRDDAHARGAADVVGRLVERLAPAGAEHEVRPSAASASADARPRPRLEAATRATRPRMPRSMSVAPHFWWK
jgi:hypothetical protein